MPLILGVALFVGIVIGISKMLSPDQSKSKTTQMKDEFTFPTISTSRLKPKLYGTRWINSPNVADYGQYKARAIWSDEVYDD
jgi:hypothetical protein